MHEAKPLPLLPVFLPSMLVLCCLCLPTAPLLAVSRGQFAYSSMLMICGGTITGLVATAGLALTRSGSAYAKHLRWLAYTLAAGLAAWIVLRSHFLVQEAVRGADPESQRVFLEHGAKEMPWVVLAAVLSIVPSVLGGVAGAFWIEAIRRRNASAPSDNATRTLD